jgi:hypothetical protein
MEQLRTFSLEESFARFEKAAAKEHQESIWIVSLLKDVEMEKNALIGTFAKTEEPLGYYFAGRLSAGRELFDFFKKSAEAGCSWGQLSYGLSFRIGEFVEKDVIVHLEWLEKAAKQNNPQALHWLGNWFGHGGGDDQEKAMSYFRAGAVLGWGESMDSLSEMWRNGEGCAKDWRQALIWSAKGSGSYVFWDLLRGVRGAQDYRATEELECDFNQLCYSLGWGLYWYQYESEDCSEQEDEDQAFGSRCLDYYCSCVELQQKSILTFLLCWNRTTGGVKGPGQLIAQMVWDGREDNLMKTFEESAGKEPETKRIKK